MTGSSAFASGYGRTPQEDGQDAAASGRTRLHVKPFTFYSQTDGLPDPVDGSSRTVKVGNQEIVLKQISPRNMATAGRISGLVIQALRHLGREHVDDRILDKLAHRLDQEAVDQLKVDIRFAPGWIADLIRTLQDRPEFRK